MALMKEVNEKVYKIIGSCIEVHKTLGPGYPIDFYNKALEIELALKELPFEAQKSIDVSYKDTVIGTIVIDFKISDDVVLILRSQDGLQDTEVQQVLRYLQLSGSSIGILVNFGLVKIQYKRIMPSRQHREPRKDNYRPGSYREIGRTREGNPAI